MNYGRVPMGEYLAKADRNVFVAVMIETLEALDDVRRCASIV